MSNEREDIKLMNSKELYRLWKETRDEKYLYAFVDAKENDTENLKVTKKIFERIKDS
jgi:uncharacterized protein YprB with RNaseH-like and TPR domain